MARTSKKNPVSKDETKAEKFRRLANQRLPKAIKSIESFSSLAGPNYERTEEQVSKLINALRCAVARVEQAFASGQGGYDVPVI